MRVADERGRELNVCLEQIKRGTSVNFVPVSAWFFFLRQIVCLALDDE